MLIAGGGTGLLNGQTVKVLQAAVPEGRAGMASGLASTTRFTGILVSVAALGAVLSNVTRDRFVAIATKVGLTAEAAVAAARVTSGRRPQGVSDNAWSSLRAAPKLPSW
jgi:hypothetical protein